MLLALFASTWPALAQPFDADPGPERPLEVGGISSSVLEQVSRSVYELPGGFGFVVADGMVLTTDSVAEAAGTMTVGRQQMIGPSPAAVSLTRVACHRQLGLAVYRADDPTALSPPLALRVTPLDAGAFIAVVGPVDDLVQRADFGVRVEGAGGPPSIAYQSLLHHAQTGAPVIDDQGQVVGVHLSNGLAVGAQGLPVAQWAEAVADLSSAGWVREP